MDSRVYYASLLDRLSSDPDAGGTEGYALRTKREWEETLLSEIELLLNTKRGSNEVPDEYTFCSESLLVYGVPDCTGVSVRDPSGQAMLRAEIEATLRRFEPRLSSVSVLVEPPAETEPVLRFTVDALFRMESETEPIRFETVLHTDQTQFRVRRGS